MSSNWKLLVDAWQKGDVEFEEVVTEAALGDQLKELEAFLHNHSRSFGSLFCSCFLPSDWALRDLCIEQDSILVFIYFCAYHLLNKGDISRGLELIKKVCGEEKCRQWTEDTLHCTLDNAVRNQLAQFAKQNNSISNEDDEIVSNLMTLQTLYPIDSFDVSLGKCLDLSKKASFVKTTLSQMQTLVLKVSGKMLKEDVCGVNVSPGKGNIWEAMLNRGHEWDKFKTSASVSRHPNSKQQDESRLQSSSPLFLKTAVNWFHLSADSMDRILYEGEILHFHLTGSLPEASSSYFEDPVKKWKAKFQFRISHHLIHMAAEQLSTIPEILRSESTLKISRSQTEDQQECFTHPVKVLDFLSNEDCSTYGQCILEEKLIKQGLWLKTEWTSFEEWLSFLSRTNQLFANSPTHKDVQQILQNEVIVQWMIEFCVQNQLPYTLELYLYHQASILDEKASKMIISSTGSCYWAQWLVFSKIPKMKFAASVANAKYILQKENMEFHSLAELVHRSSVYVSLATLAQSPIPLTSTLLMEPENQKNIQESANLDSCPILPFCGISDLETELQATFPETMEALRAVAVKGRYQGKLTLLEFKNWKKLIFRDEVNEVSILDMIEDYNIPEINQLMKLSLTTNINLTQDNNLPTEEDAGYWEQLCLHELSQWLTGISTDRNPPGLMLGICQLLSTGRPVAAFQWYLASKQQSNSAKQIPPMDCIDSEDLQFLEQIARVVGILSFKDPLTVSSCLVFSGLCGFTSLKIKVDICALQKFEFCSKQTNQEMMQLANNLALEVLAMDQTLPHDQTRVSAEILKQLESTALQEIRNKNSPVLSRNQGQFTGLEESISVLLKWSLVHAFAQVHNLTLSKQLLKILAEQNDWILFLTEANYHQEQINEVIELAEQHFSDQKLRHHVCLILQDPVDEPLISQSSQRFSELPLEVVYGAFTDAPSSTELFGILLEAERTGPAATVLLHWAWKLKWRILTLIAACYSSSCYLQSFIVWLRIGAGNLTSHEEEEEATESSNKDERFQLIKLVSLYCSTGAYEEVLKAMSLFPSTNSAFDVLKQFLIALKFHSQHFLKFSSLHFTQFGVQFMSKDPTAKQKEFIEEITKASIFAVLKNLPSIFEKQTLLDLLVNLEAELHWLQKIKTLKLTYDLLEDRAEEFIEWKLEEDSDCGFCPFVDLERVLMDLQRDSRWLEARQWASANHLSLLNVTTAQAESVIQEWTELELDTELLWEEVNQLFLDYEHPALSAGLFYIKQAAKSPVEARRDILLEALSWLDGSRSSGSLECSEILIQQLRLALYSMESAELVIRRLPYENSVFLGKDRENSAAIEMILQPIFEPNVTLNDNSKTVVLQETQSMIQSSNEVNFEEQEGVELLIKLVPVVSETAVENTVNTLLDSGHIDAARVLATDQALPENLEFRLVDTALTIVHEFSSNQWTDDSPVLTSILEYLKNRGFLQEQDNLTPQGVLDAVLEASAETGGYQICARSASAFKAANLLNMSCAELASCGLSSALELILLQGPAAFPIAQEFIKAFDFTPREVANKIAHAYLNSLMGMETTTSRSSHRKLDSESYEALSMSRGLIIDFQICSDWVEIGNALMQLLVERHCALHALIEADILVQAFKIHQFSVDEKYEALVRVSVGICHFEGLMEALDSIVRNKKLSLLLQDNDSHDPFIRSTLSSALLSSIHRNCPGDAQMLALTHRHFNMHVGVGQGLKERAQELLVRHILYGRPSRDAGLLQAMDLLIHAGAAYSAAECSISAADCGSLVALTAQQACFGDRQWVCLTDAECKELLPELTDISSALLVARAYKFNSAQDWVLTLWQHMLHVAKEFNNNKNPASGALTRAIESMGQYCKAVMRVIIFTENHLDQIVQMYVACTFNPNSAKDPVNQDVLARCVVKFLGSIIDVRQRLRLCESLRGSYLASIGEYHQIFENSSYIT
eukprot:g806.t1